MLHVQCVLRQDNAKFPNEIPPNNIKTLWRNNFQDISLSRLIFHLFGGCTTIVKTQKVHKLYDRRIFDAGNNKPGFFV